MSRPNTRPLKSESLRLGLGIRNCKVAQGDSNVQLENHWLGVKTRWGLRNHPTQCHTVVKMIEEDLYTEVNITVWRGGRRRDDDKLLTRRAKAYK